MLETPEIPFHPAPPRFNSLLRHYGFAQSKNGPRVAFHQWHRGVGRAIGYFVDVYAADGWVEAYTRPLHGKCINERFTGVVETEIDFARLLWQCRFITAQEWAYAQNACVRCSPGAVPFDAGPAQIWSKTPNPTAEPF